MVGLWSEGVGEQLELGTPPLPLRLLAKACIWPPVKQGGLSSFSFLLFLSSLNVVFPENTTRMLMLR